jgi:hydroxymethylglutaryl-CoA lyase
MALPTIIIEEQGLRDGLQTLAINIPTIKKIEWINKLIEAGVKRIQVASFVHPKLVAQLADAEEIIAALPINNNVIFSALVLNKKGIERAIATGINNLAISISASNTHSKKNTNKTLEEAKIEFDEMTEIALKRKITVRGGIQCAFGCRYEGKINEDFVYELVSHYINTGVHEIALADSTGMANPVQVKRMMTNILAITKNIPVTLHLHNTENKGYSNLVAALETGVTQYDTAFGGLGGCPFIKNATGNIATEDVVNMLTQMGYETNINISKIAEISNEMEKISGEKLPGLLYKIV